MKIGDEKEEALKERMQREEGLRQRRQAAKEEAGELGERLKETEKRRMQQSELAHYREFEREARELDEKMNALKEEGLIDDRELKRAGQLLGSIEEKNRLLMVQPFTQEKKERLEQLRGCFLPDRSESPEYFEALAAEVDELQKRRGDNRYYLERKKQEYEQSPLMPPQEYEPQESFREHGARPVTGWFSLTALVTGAILAGFGIWKTVALLQAAEEEAVAAPPVTSQALVLIAVGVLLLLAGCILGGIFLGRKRRIREEQRICREAEKLRKEEALGRRREYEDNLQKRKASIQELERACEEDALLIAGKEAELGTYLSAFGEARIGTYTVRMNTVRHLYEEWKKLEEMRKEDRAEELRRAIAGEEIEAGRLLGGAYISIGEMHGRRMQLAENRARFDTLSARRVELSALMEQFEATHDMEKLRAGEDCSDDGEELKERIEALGEEEEEINLRLHEAYIAMAPLRDYLEQLPELREERLLLEGEIERLSREAGILDLTQQYLQQARETFEEQYSGKVSERMKEYMEILSEGSSVTFGRMSLDIKLSARFEEYGERKELAGYSAGMQDLVRLCERFAIIDALYTGERPFIVLDDPFVNFDDVKITQAMRFLEAMSRKYQLIYFTCHPSRIRESG